MKWLWARIKGGGALVWLLLCAVVGMGIMLVRTMVGGRQQADTNKALGDAMARARKEQEDKERELQWEYEHIRARLAKERLDHENQVLNYPDSLSSTLRRYNARLRRRKPGPTED